ncbi:hypothetical protein EDB81DRAFT_171255 [Dactylonectria macrodidyma]|uniref:Uncharacterized protein n=1 Tax=Dactylonectria macrodidyma TaxID=307937 RepID=A0A9P9FQN5_9HYPO|nr:hypothetical protein EDB81DRAFT_171255 [Dactylonectria macrodidyma]
MMATMLPQTLPTLAVGYHPSSSTSISTSPNINHARDTTANSAKSTKRLPQNLPGCLPILPYTSSEWAKAIADVKLAYVSQRYRPCAARCTEILDNLRDAATVKPAYLIYLHFYAASAQEMMSRGLHHASTARVNFLHQAQDHYLKASHLIATIDVPDADINQALFQYSASTIVYEYDFSDSPSSILSSLPSATWSPSMRSMPSWGPSPSSSNRSSVNRSSVDRFSMDSSRGTIASSSKRKSDSHVRPDSPTLGLSLFAGGTFQDILNAMPSPPPTVPAAPPEHVRAAPPAEPVEPAGAFHLPQPIQLSPSIQLPERVQTPESFQLPEPARPAEPTEERLPVNRAAHRSSALLSGLQRQITRHLSFIDADLAAARNPPPTATNLGLHDDEHRALDLQARIERLRASGWQRKRFDFQRYKQLREKAMADMME